MSINNLVDSIEDAARKALFQTKAIRVCSFHTDAVISNQDSDAEKHAYAIATNDLKVAGEMFLREDVMAAIKHELDMADDECHQCAAHRDD